MAPPRTNISLLPANDIMQVDTIPPSEMEAIRGVGFLEKHKVAEPDGLFSSFFMEGGKMLEAYLPKLLGLSWARKSSSRDYRVSVIVPIYNKRDAPSCENHKGIIFVNVGSKLLASISPTDYSVIAKMYATEQRRFLT